MKRRSSLLSGLTLSAWLLLTTFSQAQTIDPEVEFIRIRDLAFSGLLTEAEESALILVDSFPTYNDAKVLLARIYAWQKKYDPALGIIESVLTDDRANTDAAEAKGDILRWIAGDKAEAEEAERRRMAEEAETERRRMAEEAEAFRSDSLALEAHKKAISDSLIAARKMEIFAGYYFDTFSEPYSRFWQVYRAGGGYLTRYGKVLGAINTGHLIAGGTGATRATDIQLEAEAYPVISPSLYGWLNYAWSPGDYFPGHRASAEIWYSVGSGWVASSGLNYYYFDRNIFISTISAEKYLGSWWFSGRLYFYFKDSGITNSLFVNARKYFNDTDYLQLTAGTGTAPDEPFDIRIDLARLGANTFKIAYNRQLTGQFSVKAGVGYAREEYQETVHRNRFDGTINLSYKFSSIR
jgi:YaiO family outer membrane protein